MEKGNNLKRVAKGLLSIVFSASLVAGSFSTAFAARTSNDVTPSETAHRQLAYEAATEGMVLLENNNKALPIPKNGEIALFGGPGSVYTVKGGTGSGDVNQREVVTIFDGFKAAGYDITTKDYLDGLLANTTASTKEAAIPSNVLTAAKSANTAVYVVSRNSGEGADRTATKGDYYLTDIELANIKAVAANFEKVIVVLNVGGTVDTSFFKTVNKEIPNGIDSLFLMSQGGMEGGNALVKLLNGTVTPSGKLSDTWAAAYADYPSSQTFSTNDNNSLQENYTDDIYVGYRYFDSFGVTPAYEFGYGLSYTNFKIKVESVESNKDTTRVKAKVTNIGKTYSGKEIVEIYFSAPSGNIEKPYQELAAFAKTKSLPPGASQTLEITFDTTEMSSYYEEKAAYVMEAGKYIIRVGDSSRNTTIGAVITLDKDVITEKLSNQSTADKSLSTISSKGKTPFHTDTDAEIKSALKLTLKQTDFKTVNNATKNDAETVTTFLSDTAATPYEQNASSKYLDYNEELKRVTTRSGATLQDVANGTISMEQFVAGMTPTELVNITNGIMGVTPTSDTGASANSVRGGAGETTQLYYSKTPNSDEYADYGIPNIVLADGPAGLRLTKSYTVDGQTYYQYATAWPIGTSLAQTWNTDLNKKVGNAVGEEMTEYGVTLWLAPGMNIHRNPLCGRNFEYFSEDPFLTGIIASGQTLGVQEHPGIGVTVKHLSANNQENNRKVENNSISERALREIYLKGFEIAVKSAQPMAIMTSYNKINSEYAASDWDLLENIVRSEWGFKGLIMSDWVNNASPASEMHGGNDIIMPGSRQNQLINAINGIPTLPTFTTTGDPIQGMIQLSMLGTYMWGDDWKDFNPSAKGKHTLSTTVARGVTLGARVTDYVNAGIATVVTNSDGTRTVTYKGDFLGVMYLGDLQKSAMNVLHTIMQTTQYAKLYGSTAKSYTTQFTNLKQYLNSVETDSKK
ncbi:glycoside hydrolase family 3 C-terminal domain-containing protein [Bacillus sp. ISL-18]|uniref:glycoside hydrolase family 3 protein n=1 Tax=Bacillus sp. ISL-18 TaxID=2819118 RepID=UPI001BEA8045|nr:glycoside hydrolase family 3 protein [Bacillus sp. ISL-18]MBT2658368.1 glycoside hydrolase family 3 C-terminal domain-containing protein [Bacillus sp. ISL-18]